MADLDRRVAGITCREVLGLLSGYLDGELDPATVRRLEAHAAGCDNCARFGGRFGDLIERLRAGLAPAPPLDAPRATRLRDRLADEGR